MKTIVASDECTVYALCVYTCPEVFRMVVDLAVAKQDEVPFEVGESCSKPLRIVLLRRSE